MSASGEVRLKVVEASAEGCYCVHKKSLGSVDTLWDICHGARPAGNKETFRKYIKRKPMSIYRQPIHGLFPDRRSSSCHVMSCIVRRGDANVMHAMQAWPGSEDESELKFRLQE